MDWVCEWMFLLAHHHEVVLATFYIVWLDLKFSICFVNHVILEELFCELNFSLAMCYPGRSLTIYGVPMSAFPDWCNGLFGDRFVYFRWTQSHSFLTLLSATVMEVAERNRERTRRRHDDIPKASQSLFWRPKTLDSDRPQGRRR